MSKACNACRKPIVFITTTKGKKMPCECDPIDTIEAEDGQTYITQDGVTIRFNSMLEEHLEYEELWEPHWNNCGGAERSRKSS